MKKTFIGELDGIAPSKLVNKSKIDDLDRFFLVLSLIYNDLKGLIIFDTTLRETYEWPLGTEPSVHAGEFAGLRLHIERLLIGLVSEFFIFLKKNEAIIGTYPFQMILNKLSKDDVKYWKSFQSAVSESSEKDSFFSKLARIRGNIVFHYDHSGDELVSGFIDKFYNQEKTSANKKAFFSSGDNMESTRFFYCDASVESYLMEHLKVKPTERENYQKELQDQIANMNLVIGKLIRKYLENKK